MSLRDELFQQVDAYLNASISLDEVMEWLAAHAQETTDDPTVRLPAGRLWILISEYDLGHRDEASIREELQALRVAA